MKTLAASVGEDERTIEDVYEPHLLRQGLLMKSPQGRRATTRAYEILGIPSPFAADRAADLAGDAPPPTRQTTLPFGGTSSDPR